MKDKPIPKKDEYISGFCLPAISRLYGYGYLVKEFPGVWSFMTCKKIFVNISSVTHWMPLPEEP